MIFPRSYARASAGVPVCLCVRGRDSLLKYIAVLRYLSFECRNNGSSSTFGPNFHKY